MSARKALLVILVNFLGAPLGVVTLFFIGRYMGPGPLGAWGLASAIVGLFSLLGSLGFHSAHVKRVSEGQDLGTCLATYTWIQGTLALGFSASVIIGAMLWDRFYGFTDVTLGLVVMATMYAGFNLLRLIPQQTFDALRYTARTQILIVFDLVLRTAFIVLAALGFAYFNGVKAPLAGLFRFISSTFGVEGPMNGLTGGLLLGAANTLAMAASVLLGFYLLAHYRLPFGRFSYSTARSYAAFAFPIILVDSIGTLYSSADKLMVGFFWSGADVGYYVAAQRIAYMLMVIPYATGLLMAPLMSELFAAKKVGALNETVEHVQRLTSLVAIGAVMFFLVYPAEGIRMLLSEAFLPATPVLQVLAIHFVLVAFSTIHMAIIFGLGRPGILVRVTAVSGVLNIVLNAVMIPSSLFGVPMLGLTSTGAALATVISQFVALSGYVWATRSLTGGFVRFQASLKHVLAASVTGALLYFSRPLPIWGGLDRFLELGFAGVVGSLLYVGMLWAMREVTAHDYRFFRDLLSPGQMGRYLRDELVSETQKK